MNCCDDAGKCHQGENCAIRRAYSQPFTREHTVRRYRAGQPAEIPMPTLPIDVVEPDPPDGLDTLDWVLIMLFIGCITFFLFVTLWGWV